MKILTKSKDKKNECLVTEFGLPIGEGRRMLEIKDKDRLVQITT